MQGSNSGKDDRPSHSRARTASPTVPYSPTEICFLINWFDYCIAKRISFQKTILKEFKRKFRREISPRGSERKVFDSLRRLGHPKALTIDCIRQRGSSSVEWSSVDPDTRKMQNQGRSNLRLPPLSVRLCGNFFEVWLRKLTAGTRPTASPVVHSNSAYCIR